MLFAQGNAVHDHAPVDGFAHVINREEADLYGGECFHLYARGANRFGGGGAVDAVETIGIVVGDDKLDGNAGERQRVAQGNEFAGFLGRHDGGNAGDAQHIAFFGGPAFNQGACAGQHFNAAGGNGDALGAGFVGHVYHVGQALRVEVGELGHG